MNDVRESNKISKKFLKYHVSYIHMNLPIKISHFANSHISHHFEDILRIFWFPNIALLLNDQGTKQFITCSSSFI